MIRKIKHFFRLNYTRVKFFILRKLGLYNPMTAQAMKDKFVSYPDAGNNGMNMEEIDKFLNQAQKEYVGKTWNSWHSNNLRYIVGADSTPEFEELLNKDIK